MRKKVEDAIKEIRKSLQKGLEGDVELVDVIEDSTVKIKLVGKCTSRPMSMLTVVEKGVETMLKKRVPEVKEVIFL